MRAGSAPPCAVPAEARAPRRRRRPAAARREQASAGSSSASRACGVHRLQRVERHGLRPARTATAGVASQRDKMRAAAERRADVLGQHADIGALAAVDAQHRRPAASNRRARARGSSTLRGARGNLDAFARIFVKWRPACLSAECMRRHLRDRAGEARQCPSMLAARDTARPRSVSLRPPHRRSSSRCRSARSRRILVARRAAPARTWSPRRSKRQQARGQRVERAGMSGLLGREQAPRPLQRGVGRQARRLVEQQHAVDTARGAAARIARHGSRRAARAAVRSAPVPASRPQTACVDRRLVDQLRHRTRLDRIVVGEVQLRHRVERERCDELASAGNRPCAAAPVTASAACSRLARCVKKTFACDRSGVTSTAVIVTGPTRGSFTSSRRSSASSRWIWSATRLRPWRICFSGISVARSAMSQASAPLRRSRRPRAGRPP